MALWFSLLSKVQRPIVPGSFSLFKETRFGAERHECDEIGQWQDSEGAHTYRRLKTPIVITLNRPLTIVNGARNTPRAAAQKHLPHSHPAHDTIQMSGKDRGLAKAGYHR
eukprot:2999750-Amphidinium_carterae.1